ncbi:MAG: apolipoprotein N-acyltransferase [Fimbriimonadales bacterium]
MSTKSRVLTRVRERRGGGVVVLVLSALLSGLAHPPLSVWWLILIAPAPLFALTLQTRARLGFAYGWLWSFVYYLILGHPLLYLIHLQTESIFLSGLGLTLAAGVGALFGGLFGLLASQMPRTLLGILGAAGAWAFTQYLRGLGPFAFVWGHWSVALYEMPLLLQPAELVGAWGMEFLIALWNGLLVYGIWLWRRGRRTARIGWAVGMLLIAGAFWMFGAIKLGEQTLADARIGRSTRLIALVQPNVNLAQTYTPDSWTPIRQRIAEQVRQASQLSAPWRAAQQLPPQPDLIVLPEVIEPLPMPETRSALLFWQSLSQEVGTPLLVGGYRVAQQEPRQIANTMFLFLPQGEWRYHDKVQLVPLGEYVPFRELLPFLSVFGVVEEDMYAGRDLQPLTAGDLNIGAVICMESTYPWITREMVNAGANIIVVGSNESWFGRTAALEQHLAFCVLRAIETRRWVVRCAPEGISASVAPSGEIRQRVPAFQESIITTWTRIRTGETLYVRWGDWMVGVGVACAALAILLPRWARPV